MTVCVLDTNVAVTANGKNDNADAKCQLACVEELEEIRARRVVVIDNEDLIFDEYKKHLSFAGAPGTGDKFFKYVFDHSYDETRVRRVSITPCDDDGRGFEELPENQLDRSDRKFLAAAVVAHATILNAADSDWIKEQRLTERLGVDVREICPHTLKTSTNRR